jgi:hypothetical protein
MLSCLIYNSFSVGFLTYVDHGCEHGRRTYHLNAILNGNLIFYLIPYTKLFKNENRSVQQNYTL